MTVQFGRYELLERISVGGMAEVFKGRVSGAAGFEKIVAIKRILPNLSDDQEFISMFVDEAKISANLNHSNIGQVFEFGKIESRYFIAMEYIHGKDLRRIQEYFRSFSKSMPVPMAIRVMLEVCNALEYAHNKRDTSGQLLAIVHRDISPQNVLISYEGAVKLIDFGIAKALSRSTKTSTGNLKGKFSYMSPEQVEGDEVDNRSDLFAAGTVVHELLTGQRLFHGDGELATLEQVRTAQVPPPSAVNASVPKTLDGVILKALARRPEDRYQRAEEFHEALERFAQTARMTFSTKQLSRWMKSTFAAELEKDELATRPEQGGIIANPTQVATAGDLVAVGLPSAASLPSGARTGGPPSARSTGPVGAVPTVGARPTAPRAATPGPSPARAPTERPVTPRPTNAPTAGPAVRQPTPGPVIRQPATGPARQPATTGPAVRQPVGPARPPPAATVRPRTLPVSPDSRPSAGRPTMYGMGPAPFEDEQTAPKPAGKVVPAPIGKPVKPATAWPVPTKAPAVAARPTTIPLGVETQVSSASAEIARTSERLATAAPKGKSASLAPEPMLGRVSQAEIADHSDTILQPEFERQQSAPAPGSKRLEPSKRPPEVLVRPPTGGDDDLSWAPTIIPGQVHLDELRRAHPEVAAVHPQQPARPALDALAPLPALAPQPTVSDAGELGGDVGDMLDDGPTMIDSRARSLVAEQPWFNDAVKQQADHEVIIPAAVVDGRGAAAQSPAPYVRQRAHTPAPEARMPEPELRFEVGSDAPMSLPPDPAPMSLAPEALQTNPYQTRGRPAPGSYPREAESLVPQSRLHGPQPPPARQAQVYAPAAAPYGGQPGQRPYAQPAATPYEAQTFGAHTPYEYVPPEGSAPPPALDPATGGGLSRVPSSDGLFHNAAIDAPEEPKKKGLGVLWVLIGIVVMMLAGGSAAAYYFLVYVKRPGVDTAKIEPKTQPKIEPKVEPKAQPKVEPKIEPKAQPKVEPKIEPKIEPKVEPKVEPKIEPKAQPKIEPKAQPKVEPKKVAEPKPKREPKKVAEPKPKREPKKVAEPKPKREPKKVAEPKPKREPKKVAAVDTKKGKTGSLIVASKPFSRIFVDGKDSGRFTPVPPANPLVLKAGPHKITLEVGDKKFTFPVVIRAGEIERLIKTLPVNR